MAMRVTATADAAEFIRTHGGQLFVWPAEHRSARLALVFLEASVDPSPRALDFRRVEAGDFLLFLHPALKTFPKNCSSCSAAAAIRTSRHTGTGSPTLSCEQRRRVGPGVEGQSSAASSCLVVGGAWKAPPAPVPEAGRAGSSRATLPAAGQPRGPLPTRIELSYLML